MHNILIILLLSTSTTYPHEKNEQTTEFSQGKTSEMDQPQTSTFSETEGQSFTTDTAEHVEVINNSSENPVYYNTGQYSETGSSTQNPSDQYNDPGNSENTMYIKPTKFEQLIFENVDCEILKREIPNLQEEIQNQQTNPLLFATSVSSEMIWCLLNNGANPLKADVQRGDNMMSYFPSPMDNALDLQEQCEKNSSNLSGFSSNHSGVSNGYTQEEMESLCSNTMESLNIYETWKNDMEDKGLIDKYRAEEIDENEIYSAFLGEPSNPSYEVNVYENKHQENQRKDVKTTISYTCKNNKFRNYLDIIMAIHCGTPKNLKQIIKSIPGAHDKVKAVRSKYQGLPMIYHAVKKANFRKTKRSFEIVDILIENGVLDYEPDKTIALLASVIHAIPSDALVKKILAHNTNPDDAIMAAARNGYVMSIKTLIEKYGANINFISHGQTPLEQAARKGHYHTVDYMLRPLKVNKQTLETVINNAKKGKFCFYSSSKINRICSHARYPKDKRECKQQLREKLNDCKSALQDIKRVYKNL